MTPTDTAVRTVPSFDTYRYGMVAVDTDGRVADFEEKPRRTTSTLASMGVYIFKREALAECLLEGPGKRCARPGQGCDPRAGPRAKSVLTPSTATGPIRHRAAYYEANMALLAENARTDLYDPARPVYTRSEERRLSCWALTRGAGQPPVRRLPDRGTVIRSIISPGSTWRRARRCVIPSS